MCKKIIFGVILSAIGCGNTIYTYPDEEKDIIYLIEFSTDANIGIESNRNDVETAYGLEYTEMNQYIMYEANKMQVFQFSMIMIQ